MQREIIITEEVAKDTGKHYYRAIASVPTSIYGYQAKSARIQKSLNYLLAQDPNSTALYPTPPHIPKLDFYENKENVDNAVEAGIPLYKKLERAIADLAKNFELTGATFRQFRVSNIEEKNSENPRGRCLVQLEWQWQSSADHRRTSIDLTCGIDETRSAALQLLAFVKQNPNAFNNPRKAPSVTFDPNFDIGSQRILS